MNIGYLTNFIVYVFAMSGVMLIAVSIYKKICGVNNNTKEGRLLSVQDKLTIAPRKNLYVIKAGEEYFLVAGDTERTTMLSKLDINKPHIENKYSTIQTTNEPYKLNENDFSITNKRILQRINEQFKN